MTRANMSETQENGIRGLKDGKLPAIPKTFTHGCSDARMAVRGCAEPTRLGAFAVAYRVIGRKHADSSFQRSRINMHTMTATRYGFHRFT